MAAIEQRFRPFEQVPAPPADEVEHLYIEHRAAVRAICLAVLRDRDEADDAVQQVFLSALRSLHNGTVPRDPGAWLATIARRESWARARQPAAAPLPEDMGDAAAADFSEIATRRAELAEVWRAIADLPCRQREALLLRELRGLGYEELAALMELSHPSIRSLLTRARRTLQSRLERGAAALGSAPWLNLFSRLIGDGSTPAASAVTRTAAVGLSAVVLTGSAVVAPRLAAHHSDGQRGQTSVTRAPASDPPPGTAATQGRLNRAAKVRALAAVPSRTVSPRSHGRQRRSDDRESPRGSSGGSDGRRDGGDGGRIDVHGSESEALSGEGSSPSSSSGGSPDGGDSSVGSGSSSSAGRGSGGSGSSGHDGGASGDSSTLASSSGGSRDGGDSSVGSGSSSSAGRGSGGSGSSGHDGGLSGGTSGESGSSSGALQVVAPSPSPSDGSGPGSSDGSVASGPIAGGGSNSDGSGGSGSGGFESSSGPGGSDGSASGGSGSDNGS